MDCSIISVHVSLSYFQFFLNLRPHPVNAVLFFASLQTPETIQLYVEQEYFPVAAYSKNIKRGLMRDRVPDPVIFFNQMTYNNRFCPCSQLVPSVYFRSAFEMPPTRAGSVFFNAEIPKMLPTSANIISMYHAGRVFNVMSKYVCTATGSIHEYIMGKMKITKQTRLSHLSLSLRTAISHAWLLLFSSRNKREIFSFSAARISCPLVT